VTLLFVITSSPPKTRVEVRVATVAYHRDRRNSCVVRLTSRDSGAVRAPCWNCSSTGEWLKISTLIGVHDQPIGVFDSGFGGLTVARALIDLLPNENLVYFGDTDRYPYGPRTLDQVRGFARQIAQWLVDEVGVKAIVIACNTASAAALEELQAECPVPVIGVIEPGVRSAIDATTQGRVGVIGTVTTIASGAYQQAFASVDPTVDLICAACPGFVEFVERGDTASDQALVLAERLLAPVVDAKVDSLLLGCTHYPFLARTISRVMGRDVTLVSSADETAFAVRRAILDGTIPGRMPRGNAGHRWVSSGTSSRFQQIGEQLLGIELAGVEPHSWY
jgi:glutamate racemase